MVYVMASYNYLFEYITFSACVSWMIDGGVHCSCWMQMEECPQHRRGQYRLRRDRETPEKVDRRRHRNREYLQCWRATMTALEQSGLERTKNVQDNMSASDLMCILTHSLTWTSYLSWQALLKYHWDYFLCFEQQQRGNANRHALSLINHGDASDE